ncbi:cytochrome bd-I ubiquinol oxidase subunit 1 apoprotein [Desulfomicrobium apsheronum]|uniref:Cytochrome bd-I ubiquinol oxidase subunit 1 apoprotein n=1 Tax=Desulfomicrobium apsheronum TaxID=52560 RepID=A0A1I3TKQ6_9BACT|nr:cytochrome ubiquinol oxidase subunit I [Desulfomicrobium apsheronum]MDY0226019.1 cytochrome ubiquinol oxidase subunit I [Desulfomicrobium apsheronum]SFJ71778.1 cytochrome bd-I ubiquinol oxidase subunit 1 apoprotein [Desulfomicrobium apsheronum]
MDVLMLSRLQFAMATMFHFIFVPLTLGLSILVAIMETKYVRTGDETYKRMTKFWGKLFVINFVLGVVTGITLEFQFGTNWSRYSEYVGDIFGSLLAIEATTSFFLESTFLGAWIFGWNILSPKMHAACIWLVAIASNLSAAWILLANAFMQNPVGYVLRNGRAELDNFFHVLLNPFGWQQYVHTLSGAFTLAGFFVMGVSAYHLLKKQNIDFFTRSFKMGMIFALVFSVLVAVQGHHHAQEVGKIQPAKLAAMESLWETHENAPMYLLVVPDEKNEKNAIELFGIPGALSFLAHGSFNTPVQGLKDWPADERPPVMLTFLSFRVMVGLGTLLPILCIWAFLRRNKLTETPRLLKAMIFAIPLPYLAIEAGWVVAEVGRQPWIVYGLMKTADAVSPIVTSQVAFSLVALTLLYALLGAVDIYLLFKFAKKGPAEA